METESSSNRGFGSKVTRADSDGGLGLKLQRTESFPYKRMVTMHHNRPFEIDDEDGGCGPTFCSVSSEENRSRSDIYDVVGVGGGGGGSAVVRPLQPFNTSAFKSPGGMAASLRFPFTTAQWQELERQALIYKYMMNSVPVPPDLLIPINRNLSDTTVASHSTLGRGTCLNLRFSNNTDPEPGRCRRTDGKKWRCSRDVAPDQKYCERHMHRGRPRSRKHVEVQSEINNNNNNNNTNNIINNNNTNNIINNNAHSTPTLTSNTISTPPHHLGSIRPYNQPSGFVTKPDFKVPPFETSRCMEWMMKGETVPMATSNQQWQQLIHSKQNSNAPVFQQHYQENLNLNSYTDFGHSDSHQESDQCCMFLNSELASLEEPLASNQRQTPRRFIDAWSNTRENPTETNKSTITENSKLSPSNLTLSMSGANGIGDEMNQIQMGLGVIDSDRDNRDGVKSQPLSWMTPPWIASPPGGPLGEVLQSSKSAANSATNKSSSGVGGLNLMSDGWGRGGETSSPQATTISSPSGVLQKTLVSLSDSSGSSSPTVTAAAKSEIALQWMNQSKLPSS